MGLGRKLLTSFITIILIVLVVFGLFAYQIAFDSALAKERLLLRSVTRGKAAELAATYRTAPSPTHLVASLAQGQSPERHWLLVNAADDTIVSPRPRTILGVDYQQFPLAQMLKESGGQHSIGDQL